MDREHLPTVDTDMLEDRLTFYSELATSELDPDRRQRFGALVVTCAAELDAIQQQIQAGEVVNRYGC